MHEAKLAKMEAEMKLVFQQKVMEKEGKLKQSEEELYARHREMKESLEKQRLELEDKKRKIESGRPLTPENKNSVRLCAYPMSERSSTTLSLADWSQEGVPAHLSVVVVRDDGLTISGIIDSSFPLLTGLYRSLYPPSSPHTISSCTITLSCHSFSMHALLGTFFWIPMHVDHRHRAHRRLPSPRSLTWTSRICLDHRSVYNGRDPRAAVSPGGLQPGTR
jgi:hypothetical protein